MFKIKLIFTTLAAAASIVTVGVSFSTETFTTDQSANVEFVTVDKDVKLSNYCVELSSSVKIDDETFDVIEDSPVEITFRYDAYSKKDYILHTDYKFNFTTVMEYYYLDHVEFDGHLYEDIANGSSRSTFVSQNVVYARCAYFPRTQHELRAEETATIEETLRVYFKADENISRVNRQKALGVIKGFVYDVGVTILDAYVG